MAHNPKFEALLQQMRELHNRKNADYAQDTNPYSNFEQAAEVAGCSVDTVFRVLIGVKLARLRELLGAGKTPRNEPVADTKLDLAMYAALWVSYGMPNPDRGSYDDRQLNATTRTCTECGSVWAFTDPTQTVCRVCRDG